MAVHIQKEAPEFQGTAVIAEEFKTIKLSDFRGKYVVLFFYPLDFTFVCPTEIIAYSDREAEFKKRGVQIVGCSVDSEFSHLAWIRMPRAEGGLGHLNYPLLSDLTKKIATDYGVLLEGGVALRGTFLIDKEGILRHITINDLPLGRSVDETLRVVDALQFTEVHGEVCPADWKPGGDTMVPDVKKSKDYFKKAGK